MGKRQAVILAGGFGTRARPLTANRPKPMLPVVNRPILEHTVRLLLGHGFTDLVFLLYHQPEVIRNYFGDGSPWGCRINYLQPGRDLGTAGATAAARPLLDPETFLVASGDVVTTFDLSAAMDFHRNRSSMATIILSRAADTSPFGVVEMDARGRVLTFVEKPSPGESGSNTVNAGYYLLEPEILDLVRPDRPCDFGLDLFPWLLTREWPLFGFDGGGYWRDLGDPEAYMEIHRDYWQGKLDLNGAGEGVRKDSLGTIQVGSGAILEGEVVFGQGVTVEAGAYLRNCVIGDGCRVGTGVQIRESVVWEGGRIAHGTRLDGCTLGTGVRTGAKTRVMSGAVVADYCKLGDRALVRPGVRIWPDRQVEDRAVVTTSLVRGEVWRRNIMTDGGGVQGDLGTDLSPEILVRLGAAWGSGLPLGSVVAVAREGGSAERMAAEALGLGLASVGVSVMEGKRLALPLLRHLIEREKLAGGVYAQRVAVPGGAETYLRLLDSRGRKLSRSATRKLERSFRQEEYRPAGQESFGKHHKLARGLAETYYPILDHGMMPERDGNGSVGFADRPPLVLGISPGSAGRLFQHVAQRAGYQVRAVGLEAEPGEGKLGVALRGDREDSVGIWISPEGEKLVLVDGSGQVYAGTDILFLFLILWGGDVKRNKVLVHLHTSYQAEKLAGSRGLTVVRQRYGEDFWQRALEWEDLFLASSYRGGLIFPAYRPYPDACFTALKLLEGLVRTGKSLREAGEELPRTNLVQASIPCQSKMREKVMELAKRFLGGQMVRGGTHVLVHEDGGWAMILMGKKENELEIWVEAEQPTLAAALLERYSGHLKVWHEHLAQGVAAVWPG